MANKQSDSSAPQGVRIGKTISFRPDQDRWLTETFGEKGNVSAFFQSLLDGVIAGKIDARTLLNTQKDRSPLQRAEAYLKAKEASMLFEEDVATCVNKWLNGHRALRVVRGRIHNEIGTFVADFSIENSSGEVAFSIQCKSNARSDRLQLALAEAMIGAQKTSRPVVTVVPYFVEEGEPVVQQFRFLGYTIVDIKGLVNALDRAAR